MVEEIQSDLNSAHLHHRLAQKAAKKGILEDALENHDIAKVFLQKVFDSSQNPKVQESVRMQIALHDKEKRLLYYRKDRNEKLREKLQALRHNMAQQQQQGESLQNSIYRTFEETESLLDQLRIQDPIATEESVQEDVKNASKKPKDDKVIIEELEVANSHLRRMVDSLFSELDACQKENQELRDRIKDLETQVLQKDKALASAQQPMLFGGAGNSGGNSEFPPLAPLEMPTFDYDNGGS